jgi:hypothetical protein
MSRLLVWCHGGCFSGGNTFYDAELRTYLSEHGWTVFPVDFSRDNLNDALEDITHACDGHNDVILGGISSGGFLAHVGACMVGVPALLVCPVIKPFDRHASLPSDLQEKQLQFFKTMSDMEAAQKNIKIPNNKRFIVYGTRDSRAPANAYSDWIGMDCVECLAIDSGHEICNNPPSAEILEGLNSL